MTDLHEWPKGARARKHHGRVPSAALIVRLRHRDRQARKLLSQAAALRQVGLSDYVRLVVLPHAAREVEAARSGPLVLSAAEQIAFWRALQQPVRLTKAQRRLAVVMRGG